MFSLMLFLLITGVIKSEGAKSWLMSHFSLGHGQLSIILFFLFFFLFYCLYWGVNAGPHKSYSNSTFSIFLVLK